MEILSTALGYVMNFCYKLLHDYGLAIILFTLISKIVLLPVSIWVQKNSIKMVKMQPDINRILIKHYGDKDEIAEEQSKLYKKEKYIKNYWNGKMNVRGKSFTDRRRQTYWKVYHLRRIWKKRIRKLYYSSKKFNCKRWNYMHSPIYDDEYIKTWHTRLTIFLWEGVGQAIDAEKCSKN